eukprot:CAMPEP_0203804856 /NCGR_PEP_ID=MMETSP0100_2-20121128/13853_1 /ASSEMBLY_ACC=CAM_ASM_000210 /TAXON_ID=96639 /ORGANISM=" , Strain NY0313808BC1" /LENGTH=113 /DNA_ID=CAMNT_0050713193 /DNA_START=327 /DNA_END=665 /DNA_ORIENTATION=+
MMEEEQESQPVVFFPPKQWSKRFGEMFFTVRVETHAKNPEGVMEYVLSVERGGEGNSAQWVNHRYSDFKAYRKELEKAGVLDEVDVVFPAKGWVWNNMDENFINARQGMLEKW